MNEQEHISQLLKDLKLQPIHRFPKARGSLKASKNQGVYVIRNPRSRVVHVGRTVRGKAGLHQRLCNHLAAQSSFVQKSLQGKGSKLREGFTYQYIEVSNDRKRALLEHAATAWHCPQHLGVGAKSEATSAKSPLGKK